ncbi:MAG: hypothetical protein OEZ32_02870 [Nitrospinota bacterium]|nr:hypothetical protein [Nitrospinota bacterium]
MRFVISVLAAAVALSAAGASAEQDSTKPLTVGIFSNIGSFSASGSGVEGSQSLAYLQMIYASPTWGAGFTSSYAAVDYTTGAAADRYQRSTVTDTAVTSFYNVKSGALRARFGVDLGLPTGQATQTSEELSRSITDDIYEDLLLLNNYGSGMNMAAHLALSYQTGRITWGLGARYLTAGAYDPMSDREQDEFDPGDSLLALASVLFSFGDRGSALLNLSRTSQGHDKQNGKDIFRNGDIMALEIRLFRDWGSSLSTSLVALERQQDKNERLYADEQYKSETGNANANSTEVFLETAWTRSDALVLTGVLGYKSVAANDYPEDDYLHDGGRTKLYIEPGLRWSISKSKLLSLKLRYSTVDDQKDSFSPAGATYSVYNVDIGIIMGF